MQAKHGFIQFLPMILLAFFAVSTLVVVGMFNHNQDIRGRAADQSPYPTCDNCILGTTKACTLNGTAGIQTCVSDEACVNLVKAGNWGGCVVASTTTTTPILSSTTPLLAGGICCPKTQDQTDKITCNGALHDPCMGNPGSCFWDLSGQCPLPPTVTPIPGKCCPKTGSQSDKTTCNGTAHDPCLGNPGSCFWAPNSNCSSSTTTLTPILTPTVTITPTPSPCIAQCQSTQSSGGAAYAQCMNQCLNPTPTVASCPLPIQTCPYSMTPKCTGTTWSCISVVTPTPIPTVTTTPSPAPVLSTCATKCQSAQAAGPTAYAACLNQCSNPTPTPTVTLCTKTQPGFQALISSCLSPVCDQTTGRWSCPPVVTATPIPTITPSPAPSILTCAGICFSSLASGPTAYSSCLSQCLNPTPSIASCRLPVPTCPYSMAPTCTGTTWSCISVVTPTPAFCSGPNQQLMSSSYTCVLTYRGTFADGCCTFGSSPNGTTTCDLASKPSSCPADTATNKYTPICTGTTWFCPSPSNLLPPGWDCLTGDRQCSIPPNAGVSQVCDSTGHWVAGGGLSCLVTPTPTPPADCPSDLDLLAHANVGSDINGQRLSASYVPSGLVDLKKAIPEALYPTTYDIDINQAALTDVKGFVDEMIQNNYYPYITYGYRSYGEQSNVHSGNPDGTAVPGYSEHQTGLAIDIQRYGKKEANGGITWVESCPYNSPSCAVTSLAVATAAKHDLGVAHPFGWDAVHFYDAHAIAPDISGFVESNDSIANTYDVPLNGQIKRVQKMCLQ